MSISKDTIVKIDLSKLDEYERSLSRIRFGLSTCRDDMYDQEMILEDQIEYPSSGYGGPSGPLEERNEVRMYRVELEEIGSMVDNMLYAISQYKKYYEGYGAYPSGELVFDATAVEIILDDFKELIWDNDWQKKIKKDDFSFNIWERSIMAGIEKEIAREKAVQYNRVINDTLRNELVAMTTILLNKTETLAGNSSVYVTNLKPLVDGVTVNEILSQFNIEAIDYKRLQANTDVLDYVENSIEASNILHDSFAEQNGEVTLDSVLENLKSGVSFTSNDLAILAPVLEIVSEKQIEFSALIGIYIEKTVINGVTMISVTEEGIQKIASHIEINVKGWYTLGIEGIYTVDDLSDNVDYISGKGKYFDVGGLVIDSAMCLESLAKQDLSNAGSAFGSLMVGLTAYGIADAWNPSGWAALGLAVVSIGLSNVASSIGDNAGNKWESNKDWFGDGID